MTRERVVVVVRGTVQGVGFRWFVLRTATALDLDGWVRNHADGSVELVAEGEGDDVARLVAAVRQGPEGAWVRDLTVRHEMATGPGGGFVIRSGGHPGD